MSEKCFCHLTDSKTGEKYAVKDTEARNGVKKLNDNFSIMSNDVKKVHDRIDNIVANDSSTEGNDELIDIRMSASGKLYDTAGEAVREQFNDVNDIINPKIFNITDLVRPTLTNKMLAITGNVGGPATIDYTYNKTRCSNVMLMLLNRTYIIKNRGTKYIIAYAILDSDFNIITSIPYTGGNIEFKKGAGAFFAFTIKRADEGEITDFDDVINDINIYATKEDIDEKSDFPLLFALYHVAERDTGYPLNTIWNKYAAGRMYSAFIINCKDNIEITLNNSNYKMKIHQLNVKSGTFICDSAWLIANNVVIDNTGDVGVRLCFMHAGEDVAFTYAEMMEICEGVTINKCDNKNNKTYVNNYDDNILVVSHRADVILAPENTMAALRSGFARGFRAFEVDVRLTSDNIPVLCHDDTIDRTSDGSGAIESLTYEALLAYDFGAWFEEKYKGEKICTFEDCVKFCVKNNCFIQIELKGNYWHSNNVKIVYDILKKYNMLKKVMWVSFELSGLQNVKFIDDSQSLGFTVFEPTADDVNKCLTLLSGKNKVYFNVKIPTGITEEMLATLRENNVYVNYYLVDTAADFEAYINKNMGGITTEQFNVKAYVNN